MSFPRTYEEIFADLLEVEYVETEAGDVYASALVSPLGRVLRVIDDDGTELALAPAERERVEAMVRERRAA